MFAGISHLSTIIRPDMMTAWQIYTKGGHQRAPTKRQVCEWVLESWRQLLEEAIEESFQSCGISFHHWAR